MIRAATKKEAALIDIGRGLSLEASISSSADSAAFRTYSFSSFIASVRGSIALGSPI